MPVISVITQHCAKIYLLHHIQIKLEWGCPNGTKYPPRQPIPNRAILPNRARAYRRTDRVIPVYPPNFVAGDIMKLLEGDPQFHFLLFTVRNVIFIVSFISSSVYYSIRISEILCLLKN